MDEYLDKAIEIAKEQFWNSIAGSFPDVKYGDIAPKELIHLDKVMKTHVKSWLKNNS